jgi:hypothetical protein
MSDVYVVVWSDRHSGPDADIFDNPEAAIEWARTQARDNDLHGV